jgi:hypothetical protein
MVQMSTDLAPEEDGAQPLPSAEHKSRKALSRLKRELSDEELSSPGVQKLLVEELEKLEHDCALAHEYRDRFYAADKEVAILKVQQKKSLSGEIIFGGCLAVGAAALGYAPAVWAQQPSGWIALIFGGVVVLLGIVARVVQR